MELNKVLATASEMANMLADILEDYFGEKIDDVVIEDLKDEPYMEFRITFVAYNYFPIYLNYDRGRFGCCIVMGDMGIDLDNSQKWYEQADMNKFCQELEKEIELRIPDKFLVAKEWSKRQIGSFQS